MYVHTQYYILKVKILKYASVFLDIKGKQNLMIIDVCNNFYQNASQNIEKCTKTREQLNWDT